MMRRPASRLQRWAVGGPVILAALLFSIVRLESRPEAPAVHGACALPSPVRIIADAASPWLVDAARVLVGDPSFAIGMGEPLVLASSPAQADLVLSLARTADLTAMASCAHLPVVDPTHGGGDAMRAYWQLQSQVARRVRRGADKLHVAFIAAWCAILPSLDD